MPNLNNLQSKSFTEKSGSRLLQVKREEILHREDIKVSFGYVVAGITVSLAIAGGIYVIGKQLLK